jgi:hypothetical protein
VNPGWASILPAVRLRPQSPAPLVVALVVVAACAPIGGRCGGWITSDVAGLCPGGPGTLGW